MDKRAPEPQLSTPTPPFPSIHPFTHSPTPIPQSIPSASFSVETALVRLAAEDFQKKKSLVLSS